MNIFTDHDNEILVLHRRVADLQMLMKEFEKRLKKIESHPYVVVNVSDSAAAWDALSADKDE